VSILTYYQGIFKKKGDPNGLFLAGAGGFEGVLGGVSLVGSVRKEYVIVPGFRSNT
jgi:hypothetical protein